MTLLDQYSEKVEKLTYIIVSKIDKLQANWSVWKKKKTWQRAYTWKFL